MKEIKKEKLEFSVHLPNIITEMVQNGRVNKDFAALLIPVMTMYGLLKQVAQRAIEIDDPELNSLMGKLTLYSCCDPGSDCYDEKMREKLVFNNRITK